MQLKDYSASLLHELEAGSTIINLKLQDLNVVLVH